MKRTIQQILRQTMALATLVVLSACGGGDDAAPPVAQTLTFAAPGQQTFSTTPLPLVATASSGLTVAFASSTPAICTVNAAALTLVGVGTCTVSASQPGNANFEAATPVARSFTVVAAAQSITFISPGNQVLSGTPPVLVASATSGLVVVVASTTPTVCTVSGTTLTLLSVGDCTLSASQVGNNNYTAATPVQHTFAVAAQFAAQTISFTAPGNQTMGVAPAALVASASSGLAVSFASTTPAVCTVSGSTLSLVTFGTCSVSASQAGNASFAAAPVVTSTFSVLAIAQTINFNSPGNQTLGGTAPTLVASATSGLPVSLVSSTPNVCTVAGTTLLLATTGTCTVDASQAGNTSFAAAAVVSQSFTVGAASQTITFVSPGIQTLGTTPAALVASASSNLVVLLTTTTSNVCTVSGTTLTLVAAGSCSVTASQAGNGTFAAAANVTHTFGVVSNAQTITFNTPATQTLGLTPSPLVATATSGLTVSLASTTPNVCTVSGTTLTLVAAGSCSIDASQVGNGTFAAAPTVSRTFSVVTMAQTITFNSPGNQTLGTAPPALVASSTSGLTVLLTSTTTGVCTVNGSTLLLVSAGSCTVEANQAGNGTFAAAATISRSFTVAAAPLTAQTITFNSPGNQTVGTAPPALLASSSSGLTVVLSSTTPNVCTVSGNTLTLVAAGTCNVDANQVGNSTFAAAPSVSRSFTVFAAPLAQSITFTSPGNQTLGTAPAALSASATSGLTVTFASTTPGVCTVAGTTLTLVAVGTCSVDASQLGNGAFLAATTVSRSFSVAAAPLTAQTISFTAPGTQTLGITPAALVASASSGLPVVLTSTTTGVCTVSGSTLTLVATGTCTLQASQLGNSTFAAATTVSRSFIVGINALANAGFEAVANSNGEFADAWQGANIVRPTRSSAEAHSGLFSAKLAVPDNANSGSGSGLFQNSVDHGGLLPVAAVNWGTSPTLTFWIKGNTSETGELSYALRYLDAIGNILNSTTSGAQRVWVGNTVRDWTQITRTGVVIPSGTTAVFLEMTLATGPTGTFPGCGATGSFCNWGTAAVYVDDVLLPLLP